MTYQQFVGDAAFRRHYWARNHLGWRHMDAARHNAGHRALAALERIGAVSGVITQNVDLLHTKAGSKRVVDLHGTYAQVGCLECGQLISRTTLAERLEHANPGFAETVAGAAGVEIAPDADAIVSETSHFTMIDCDACGGMLKPNIVYFGESVPKTRAAEAYALVDDADVLVVAGSSLTVMSGLRFVRYAVKRSLPVAIVNRGTTKGDDRATLILHTGTSETLTKIAKELSAG